MVELKEVTKDYGTGPILDGISLSVERGERVALLGGNGAGKTTLFKCMLGLTSFEGTIRVDGFDVGLAGKQARYRIGYVPQRPPVAKLTVSEFVTFFARLRGSAPGSVEPFLERFDIPLASHADKTLSELSGGMLQKILLALALGTGASVLLLDEPTANLDPGAREVFLEALGQVPIETTILLASHRLSDLQAVATRVVAMEDGRFVKDGWIEAPGERCPTCGGETDPVLRSGRPGTVSIESIRRSMSRRSAG